MLQPEAGELTLEERTQLTALPDNSALFSALRKQFGREAEECAARMDEEALRCPPRTEMVVQWAARKRAFQEWEQIAFAGVRK